MNEIKHIAVKFRAAIDKALIYGDLSDDYILRKFPYGCCGDASELLAQYLLDNGIKTFYVCGNYYFDDPAKNAQTHAWLQDASKRIIDVTGDQFNKDPVFLNYDIPVYVGRMDAFHNLFTITDNDIHVSNALASLGANSPRLMHLYHRIVARCI